MREQELQKQDYLEIDLKEIFFLLLSKLQWILLFGVLAGGVAFAITWFLLTPQYTSSISLYVNNQTDGQQQTTAGININDINASQKLVNTYMVILRNDEVMDVVINRLVEDYDRESLENIITLDAESLRNVVSMAAEDNTEVMRISVETPSAQLSARICTLITEVAPEVLERVVKAGSVEVIGEAKVAEQPSSPNLKINCAIGVLGGALLTVLVIVLRFIFNNTVKDEEDLKKHIDIPVLGEVPDFLSVKGKEGYQQYGYH